MTAPAFRPLVFLALIVPGPPRTKKNSQDVVWRGRGEKRRMYVVPSESSGEYASQVIEAWARVPVTKRLGFPIPKTTPVHVRATFYVDRYGERADVHGLYQSLADALQAARVLEDDWQIASWDGSRRVIGDPSPRTEILLAPFDGP